MTDLPPPASPAPPPPPPPEAPTVAWWKQKKWKLPVWAWIAIGLVVVAAAVTPRSEDDSDDAGSDDTVAATTTVDEEPAAAVATTVPEVDETDPPATDPPVTDAPTTTLPATTTTEAPAIGTRDNPVPLGVPMPAGDWTYEVLEFDANDVQGFLLDVNQFNDTAPPGQIYVRVKIRATYSGEGAGEWFFRDLTLVDTRNTSYASVSPCCDPDTAELASQPSTFSGGAIEGWVYYIVAEDIIYGDIVAFDADVDYTDVPGGVGFFTIYEIP